MCSTSRKRAAPYKPPLRLGANGWQYQRELSGPSGLAATSASLIAFAPKIAILQNGQDEDQGEECVSQCGGIAESLVGKCLRINFQSRSARGPKWARTA